MATRLATLSFSKEEAARKYLSYEHLYETRRDSNGPLNKIIGWLKNETRLFDTKNLKIGKPQDPYVALYYFESIRYRIERNGTALVTGADADDTFEQVEADLQMLIDTMLADEMMKTLSQAVKGCGGQMANAKATSEKEGDHSKMIVGIIGPGLNG